MTDFPLVMRGHDRVYLPPRSIRGSLPTDLTAWDLLRLPDNTWAAGTVDSLVAAIDAEAAEALGCTDCQDTGFYGVPDTADEDMLVALVRRTGDEKHELLTAAGTWEPWDVTQVPLEILSLDLAGDLAAAITGGACGLVRRYTTPLAYLAPAAVVAAAPLRDVLMSLVSPEPPGNTENSDNDWVTYAVVDELDHGAVLDLVHLRAAGDADEAEHWDGRSWVPDTDVLTNADLPMVRLDDAQLADTQEQISHSAMVADAPLTVSPNPKAEKLRRYWSTGRGGAKIRWNTPGDFTRCYRHLRKYMGLRAKGWCANMHKRNDGVWPGDRRNPGGNGRRGRLFSSASPEEGLLASVQTGQWRRNEGRTTTMTALAQETLVDGIYFEGEDTDAGILQTITAGGFPVKPPDSWFDNPKLTGPTPMVIEDDGRVYGHIATWDVTHIGMAGKTRAPHSPSNYAYYRTGAVKTDTGKLVNVGQITVAGGHASRMASAQEAIKHYDDTNSAVADVAAGEDRYGIWVAGGLRPAVTEEQIRAFRASPPSGDWREIGGHLELVAACCVNVPGFMNVRAEARVAGGAVLALVAAGYQPLVERRMAMISSAGLLERLDRIEARLPAETPAEPELAPESIVGESVAAAAPEAVQESPPAPEQAAPEVQEEPPAELTAEQQASAERIARVRDEVADMRRKVLRDQVHSASPPATTAAIPPQFLAHMKGRDGKSAKEGAAAADKSKASTVKGTDSFPISDVASLKKAIQAFGRAGDPAAAKKHIISMAYKLKRPDLIPSNWKASK